jgi:lipopolysaccharide/colanic/teichoic acid biosynthesis glycosyltransferase
MMDVAGSLLLLMSLMPLLLAVAVAVAWNSPGPVIFRQIRVGKDGTRFVMWKFRSMRTDAPMYARSPISVCDERLTRVGRWIRRLSLDELPQLFNVLRGEMSLVGPRPEMAFIADRYSATERLRLAATPGITGLWQISQDRGSAIHENLQYDLHYIREQNLRLDAAILLRTLSVVVRGADAV